MSRHTQGSLTIVGAIAAGIFLVAIVALMVLGGYGFSAALFLSILIALIAAIVLYLGFGSPAAGNTSEVSAPKPVDAPKPAEVAKLAVSEPQAAAPNPEQAPATSTAAPEEVGPTSSANDETENVGKRPESLDSPRNGSADDLKLIKGVGPKLEELCNSLGFWHFDQIANWTSDEVAWVDENLQGFKGRVSRDNWVEQAQVLAAGGETEFSKRAQDTND